MQPDSTVQFKAYPALQLAGCFATGIVGAGVLPELGFWTWLGTAVAGCAVALGVRPFFRRRMVTPLPLLSTLLVALVMVALGGARYRAQQALPPHHLAHRVYYGQAEESEPVRLEGRVVSLPGIRSSGTRFLLAADALIVGPDTLLTTGPVQVSLAQPVWKPPVYYPPLTRGDAVRLRGRLRPVPRHRNPADFDYGAYLRQRGVYVTLTVYDAADVAVIGRAGSWVDRAAGRAQARIRDQLTRFIPSEEGRAVLQALVLGDRGALGDDVRGHFAQTGLMHVLAVSGLHVLLVGMVLYGLLRPVLLRWRVGRKAMEVTRAVATMLLLSSYMVIAGAGASVVRAVVMAGLFVGGTVLQRSSHPLNTLGVAALVLLLGRPTHLFEAGFQLSFTAVAAIVVLHPILRARLPEAWTEKPLIHGLITSATVSLAATLGTMPVLLYHFGHVSFAGLLLNLLAIPLTALTLAAGLITLALAGWLPFGAEVFGAAASTLAQGLLGTAKVGDAALGWAVVRRHVQDPWYLLALVAALLTLAQWPRPRVRWRLVTVAACCAVVGVWAGVLGGRHVPGLDVLFFDVGHGDAALVALPNGRHLLIDAGGGDAFSDQGTRTLIPHLERYGIRRLDAVIISHPHGDHVGGLPAVLRAVPVGRVFHNGQPHSSSLYAEVAHLLDSLAVPHRALRAGDTLALTPSVLMQILAPDGEAVVGGEANDASVVVRLVYGETALLFAGDVEAEAERRILNHYGGLLEIDVVKVGHHGSRTSSTPAFVERVLQDTSRASIAVVSVGPRTLYGLPDDEVLTRWRRHGADVWTTFQRGALWLHSDGKQIRQVAWR